MNTCREQSKKEWTSNGSITYIQLGCLQRIADATEVMAQNHQRLLDDKDFYQRRMQEERACNEHLYRRIASLKGVITKMKKAK